MGRWETTNDEKLRIISCIGLSASLADSDWTGKRKDQVIWERALGDIRSERKRAVSTEIAVAWARGLFFFCSCCPVEASLLSASVRQGKGIWELGTIDSCKKSGTRFMRRVLRVSTCVVYLLIPIVCWFLLFYFWTLLLLRSESLISVGCDLGYADAYPPGGVLIMMTAP